MSEFPRRLVDEPGNSPTRRLLERARADAPPSRMVAAAIAAASTAAHASPAPAPPSGPRARGRTKLALVAGSLIVMGSIVTWVGTQDRGVAPIATSPATSPIVVAPPPPVVEPAPSPPGLAVTSIADLPDAPVALAPSLPRAAAPVLPIVLDSPAAPVADRSDLLREANRLRADGHFTEAAATYQRVMTSGPDSAEAYPAEVALANIDLQQSRAAAALAHYEHALAARPSGALAEEARWGKARALRAAGRTGDERAALEDFVAHHRESPLVPVATRRLAEIGK